MLGIPPLDDATTLNPIQGERRRRLGRGHGHQLSGDFTDAAVHGLHADLARQRLG